MIVIPNDVPVLADLNSYYLDLEKLFEHCQGEMGSGSIHLKSAAKEGIVYFDQDDILNGVFFDKPKEEVNGDLAVQYVVEAATEHNFIVNVYRLTLEDAYYWAHMPNAKKIYTDLSTEFTDLDGLIKKMTSEKLTGFIEARIGDGKENAVIFYNRGKVIGGTYSWNKGPLNTSKENQDLLVQKTKKEGGTFHVSKISHTEMEPVRRKKKEDPTPPTPTLKILEQLLRISERIITSGKKTREEFNTLLKRKFIEKVDRYAFLDPFIGEFSYADGQVFFTGEASDMDLARGVLESVKELARELGLTPQLDEELAAWLKRYGKQLKNLEVKY
jgi:hypothetical protein